MANDYLGSKGGAGVYQTIISAMPAHNTYYEPFIGGGNLAARKPAAQINIGSDLSAMALELCRPLLPHFDLRQADAFDLLPIIGDDGDTLIYADPPYPHETRTGKARYDYEISNGGHKRLCEILRSLPCAVMVSTYDNDIYARGFADWRKIQFNAMTRGGLRLETLYMNFAPPNFRSHGQLCRPRLHRPAAHQAQGRAMGGANCIYAAR